MQVKAGYARATSCGASDATAPDAAIAAFRRKFQAIRPESHAPRGAEASANRKKRSATCPRPPGVGRAFSDGRGKAAFLAGKSDAVASFLLPSARESPE